MVLAPRSDYYFNEKKDRTACVRSASLLSRQYMYPRLKLLDNGKVTGTGGNTETVGNNEVAPLIVPHKQIMKVFKEGEETEQGANLESRD